MKRDDPAGRSAIGPWWLAWACMAPLWLVACEARPPASASTSAAVQPGVGGAPPQLPATQAGTAGTSVPVAGAVFADPPSAAPSQAAASAAQARANGSLTAAEASTAMPLPGQANDHSVPTLPPKPPATR